MAATSSTALAPRLEIPCRQTSFRPTWDRGVSYLAARGASSEARNGGLTFFESFGSGSRNFVELRGPGNGFRRGNELARQGGGRSRRTSVSLQVRHSIATERIRGTSQFGASADQSVRRLILLRHAKSSWTDRSIKDHERPLSKRGRQAAANIALKLHECSGWEPQLILCSDSTRTRETLGIMQEQLPEFLEGEVRYFSSFYSIAAMDGQTVQHLQEIICKYSKDDMTTILCMGHNRGWEEAASVLSGASVELKTANAALLQTRGSSWQEPELFEKFPGFEVAIRMFERLNVLALVAGSLWGL